MPAAHDLEGIGRKIQGDHGEPAAACFAGVNFRNIAFIELQRVDEPRRNEGMGSCHLSKIVREAKKSGACIVMTDARDWNVDLFKKFGYTVYCTIKDYPNGHSRYNVKTALNRQTQRGRFHSAGIPTSQKAGPCRTGCAAACPAFRLQEGGSLPPVIQLKCTERHAVPRSLSSLIPFAMVY